MYEEIEHISTSQEVIDRTISQDKKKKIIQGQIQNIFGEDLYENAGNAINPIYTNFQNLKFHIIMFIIFLIACCILQFALKEIIPIVYFDIFFLTLIIIGSYFLSLILYKIILYFFSNKNICYFLFTDNKTLMKSSLGFIIISLIIYSYLKSRQIQNYFSTNAYNSYINSLVHSISLSLLSISLILLFKEFFISAINYRNQHRYYKHRIELNSKYIDLINKLNSIIPEEIYSDLKKWSLKLFNKISGVNKNIKQKDFKKYFNSEDATCIFRLFDTNHDNSIEESEFISRYLSIFQEKRNLSFALPQNSSGLFKLNIVCTICTLPLMLLLVFMCFGATKNYSSSVGVFAGGFLSLSFAFSSSIAELVDCIILIYFVRPFDIGDMIGFNDKKYIVKKIGLLYSDLIEDSTLNIVSNKFLKQQKIENYRTSSFITEKLTKYYTYNTIIGKFDTISNEISKFLEENFTSYTPVFHIYRFEIVKEVIKLNIEINIQCKFQELRTTAKRRDKFEIWFTELAKELNLEQRNGY